MFDLEKLEESSKGKWIFIIILIIFAPPVFVNVLMIIPNPIVRGGISDWISFYGSYIGAILGGIIAFAIAFYQIDKQNKLNDKQFKKMEERENDLRNINQLPSLVKIKFLLEKINSSLNAAEKAIGKEVEFNNGEKSIIDDQVPFKIDKLDENYIKAIDNITNINLQIELISIVNFYVDFQNIISINNNKNTIKLNKLRKDIEKLREITNPNNRKKEELESLELEFHEVNAESYMISVKKKDLWSSLKKEDYLKKSNCIYDNILNEISFLEEIQKKYSN